MWFWKSPEYLEWRNNKECQFLRCTGIPGIGKSVISAKLASGLSRERIHSEYIAHFFFQTPSVRSTTPFIPSLVVCSLLAQLLHTRYNLSNIHDHAVWLSNREYTVLLEAFGCLLNINEVLQQEESRTLSEKAPCRGYVSPQLSRAISQLRSLSEDDLWKILTSFVLTNTSRCIYLMIDGLDSMLNEEQSRLLRNLRNLWNLARTNSQSILKILITSRPVVIMEDLLKGLPYIDKEKEYKGEQICSEVPHILS